MPKSKALTSALIALPLVGLLAGAAVTTVSAHGFDKSELTTEQQTALEQAREYRQEGKQEEARALMEEAGLPELRREHRQEDREHHEEVEQAIENGDYEAFKSLTEDAPFAEKVDESFFEKLSEAHELREAGEHEAAKEIMEELGIEHPRGQKHGSPQHNGPQAEQN